VINAKRTWLQTWVFRKTTCVHWPSPFFLFFFPAKKEAKTPPPKKLHFGGLVP
jgi:hypothetical protein